MLGFGRCTLNDLGVLLGEYLPVVWLAEAWEMNHNSRFLVFTTLWRHEGSLMLNYRRPIQSVLQDMFTMQVIQSDLFIPKRWRSPTTSERVTWTHHHKKVTFVELPGSWCSFTAVFFFSSANPRSLCLVEESWSCGLQHQPILRSVTWQGTTICSVCVTNMPSKWNNHL